LPDGRFVTDGDSSAVIATRDIRRFVRRTLSIRWSGTPQLG
jgi:hypothetical protein